MGCDASVIKGQDLAFLARNDADTEWEIIGGAKVVGYNFDNPVDDITSSSTQGDYTESQFTGYSTATLNLSGLADIRNGVVDDATGFTIVGTQRLTELATTGNRCGKFKLFNVITNGFIEGVFTITSYGGSGDKPGLKGFDATFQSTTNVIVFGDV